MSRVMSCSHADPAARMRMRVGVRVRVCARTPARGGAIVAGS